MEVLCSDTNIGLIRNNNEDCVLSLYHPETDKIKLLLVADGMGGKQHGEVASKYVTDLINKWFFSNKPKYFNSLVRVEKDVRRLIKKANRDLIKKYGVDKLGTTLTMAIVTKNKSIIFNVGDSRAYIYKEKELIQITEDDSLVWMFYKYGEVEKDDLRYFSKCNIINSCIGIAKSMCKISCIKMDNDYDILLLFSDGVTDIITDNKILKLIKTSRRDNLAKRIVNEAVNQDQHLTIPESLKNKAFDNYIVPFKGRDNASAVIFSRKDNC